MTVATTILEQLTRARNPIGRLAAMTGAHNFIDHGAGVSFRFKGSRRFSYCKIELDATDTYTMTLGRVRKYELVKQHIVSPMYAEDLFACFQDQTGLCLSL